MGPPQWPDIGTFLQTTKLLLRGEGLDSCAQKCCSSFPQAVKRHLTTPLGD
jgi:hypothetical protein